jgi:hypothetical protein
MRCWYCSSVNTISSSTTGTTIHHTRRRAVRSVPALACAVSVISEQGEVQATGGM